MVHIIIYSATEEMKPCLQENGCNWRLLRSVKQDRCRETNVTMLSLRYRVGIQLSLYSHTHVKGKWKDGVRKSSGGRQRTGKIMWYIWTKEKRALLARTKRTRNGRAVEEEASGVGKSERISSPYNCPVTAAL